MDYEAFLQEQLSPEQWNRVQGMGLNLNTEVIAHLWPDFVNAEKRKAKEISFLLGQLEEYEKPRILDAAAGTGATAIGLAEAGLDNVVANEVDKGFRGEILLQAARAGIELEITTCDWRSIAENSLDRFHAVLLLGNSLTYLFSKPDQLKSLRNFQSILLPGGKLIIDERNYAKQFLKGGGANYVYSGEFIYCGKDKVNTHPVFIGEDMVVMEYTHIESGQRAHLVLYPFKEGELTGFLREADFRDIQTFGPYERQFDMTEAEFLTHVAKK